MKTWFKKIIDKIWNYSDKLMVEEIYYNANKPFEEEVLSFTDHQINTVYGHANSHYTHVSFIRKFQGNITIEPDYSYGISGLNNIINSSVFFKALKPSFPRYFKSKITPSTCFKIKECIVFDGQVGTNYFHFFIDVMNKLWMLEKIPFANKIPLLINEATFNTQYFQHLYLNNHFIKSQNWIVQKKNNYFNTSCAYFIYCDRYNSSYIHRTKSLFMQGVNKLNDPYRKVFLNRSTRTGRTISNFDQIKPILEKYEFEIVENEQLTTIEQIELFNSVKVLVSIHGAGNTNIIFTNKDLKFLEINPQNRISTHYYWLAKALDIHKYDCILGSNLPFTNIYPEPEFFLDPKKFEKSLATF
jgi:hypothetical protein